MPRPNSVPITTPTSKPKLPRSSSPPGKTCRVTATLSPPCRKSSALTVKAPDANPDVLPVSERLRWKVERDPTARPGVEIVSRSSEMASALALKVASAGAQKQGVGS